MITGYSNETDREKVRMRGEDVVFFKNICRKNINVGVVKEKKRWRYPYQLELSLKLLVK